MDQCGTPAYLAPEVFRGKGHTGYKSDVWSAGITLYSMLNGTIPFKCLEIQELQKMILKGKYSYVNTNLSELCKDLISQFLQVDPVQRISIDEALKHPWINSISFRDIKQKIFAEGEQSKIDAELDY